MIINLKEYKERKVYKKVVGDLIKEISNPKIEIFCDENNNFIETTQELMKNICIELKRNIYEFNGYGLAILSLNE